MRLRGCVDALYKSMFTLLYFTHANDLNWWRRWIQNALKMENLFPISQLRVFEPNGTQHNSVVLHTDDAKKPSSDINLFIFSVSRCSDWLSSGHWSFFFPANEPFFGIILYFTQNTIHNTQYTVHTLSLRNLYLINILRFQPPADAGDHGTGCGLTTGRDHGPLDHTLSQFKCTTVLPECRNDDYQSQWEKLKFDPPTTQKWPNRSPFTM